MSEEMRYIGHDSVFMEIKMQRNIQNMPEYVMSIPSIRVRRGGGGCGGTWPRGSNLKDGYMESVNKGAARHLCVRGRVFLTKKQKETLGHDSGIL